MHEGVKSLETSLAIFARLVSKHGGHVEINTELVPKGPLC